MLSKKQLFTKGMLDISPHMLSVIPFGIICGAIGVELGFSPYLVYGMLLCVATRLQIEHGLYFLSCECVRV